MYWRQALLAAGFGVTLGAVAHRLYAVSVLEAVALALGGYVSIRVLLAAYYRTRYWLDRPNKHQSRSCGNCGEYIYRRRGDLLLRCGRCGWTAGWPGVRWVTRSVPVQQIWRSITWPRLGVLVVAVGLVLLAPSLGGLPTAETVASAGGGGTSTPESVATATSTPATTATDSGNTDYSPAEVEEIFIELLNEERQKRGLQTVSQRDSLTEMGRSHSADMAEHNYIGHEEPDGSTIESRYRDRGLLPECRLPIEGSDSYYPGAENAAHFWVDRSVQTAEGPIYVDSEHDLARGLFIQWMNSPPHRDAMLVASADQAGLGIYIDDRGKVYASLELC